MYEYYLFFVICHKMQIFQFRDSIQFYFAFFIFNYLQDARQNFLVKSVVALYQQQTVVNRNHIKYLICYWGTVEIST